MSSTATAAPARSGRTGRSDHPDRPGRSLSRRFWDRWADPLSTKIGRASCRERV